MTRCGREFSIFIVAVSYKKIWFLSRSMSLRQKKGNNGDYSDFCVISDFFTTSIDL